MADAVAEFSGVFVVLGGDGFVELSFEFLEFGEWHGLFDLVGEFVEGVEGTLALELEGVLVDLRQGLDFVDGGLDDEQGFLMAVLGQLDHGGGDGVDAEDVGAPLFEVLLVFLAGGVAGDEVEEQEVAVGVAEGAGPVVELEEVEVAVVVEDTFVEELDAIVGGKLEFGVAGVLGVFDMVVESGFGAVWALAVGAAVDFVLFNAEREADLHDLAAIGEGDDADAVVGVVRPRCEKGLEVWVECHRLLTLTLPAKGGVGNCGRRENRLGGFGGGAAGAVEEMVDQAAEAVVGFCAAADDEHRQFGAVDDFAGDVAHDIGAQTIVGGRGPGDDEVVFGVLQFVQQFIEDQAMLQVHLAGDAEFLEQLFLMAEAAAEFGTGFQNLIRVLFGLDQIDVHGGRFRQDVQQSNRGIHAAGDFAGEVDGGVGLFRAAGAEEDAAQGGALADDDQHGRFDRFDDFVGAGRHAQRSAGALARGADDHEIVLGLLRALDDFADGAAGLGDQLGIKVNLLQDLLRAAQSLQDGVFLADFFDDAQDGGFRLARGGDQRAETHGVLRLARTVATEKDFHGSCHLFEVVADEQAIDDQAGSEERQWNEREADANAMKILGQ